MIVKVIGKRQGVSKKSGKAYLQATYLEPMVGGEGYAGNSVFLEPQEHNYNDIEVGAEYDIQFSRTGFLVAFEKVD